MATSEEYPGGRESKLTRSLRANGFLFPTTIEQVTFLEEQHPELFEAPLAHLLPSAADILSRGRIASTPQAPNRATIDEVTQTSLAQAAREGKAISADIAEQMRQDRQRANDPSNNHAD